MSTVEDEARAELRAKAQAATPGPWFLDGMGEDEPEVNAWAHLFVGAQDGSGYAEVVATTEDRHGPNAQYIAAASPDVVLALIDRIGALETALAASRREPSANVSNRPKDDISSDEMSVSEPSDEREALAQRYCPVHGDLLAGARSPRCSEAPKGHEFLHRQGQITDAMLHS